MLTVIASWIVISIIFLTVGDIAIYLFNKLSGRKECYSLIDTFILGLFSFLIPLSITSFWLPSNHYMLLAYLIISVFYWTVRRERLSSIFKELTEYLGQLSFLSKFAIAITILSLALYAIWSARIFDAAFYHHQFVRWNEEFAVVPGLANLETRFGFNSNYLLLSAPFTLRFIFNEPVFLIQSLLSTYIACWIITHIIKSRFHVTSIVLLVVYLLFFSFLIHQLHDSCTDIIPALVSFYIACKYILNPKELTAKYLLPVFVPIALVTFKLSIGLFAVVSLYVLYVIIKRKEYKALTVLILFAALIVLPWLMRNVIISGYLIYPLQSVDLFSFDWKVPAFVPIDESYAINNYAKYVFKDLVTFGFFFRVGGVMAHKMWFINDIQIVGLYIISLLSIPLVVYFRIKGKIKEVEYYVLYIALILSIFGWAITAPDFRFISGVMYALCFFVVVLLVNSKKNSENLTYPKLGNVMIMSFAILLLLTAAKRTFNHYHILKENPGRYSRDIVWWRQYGAEAQEPVPILFDSTYIKGIKFYISLDDMGKCFDKLPATVHITPDSMKAKRLPLEAIELRGESLQDGFRPAEDVNDGWWVPKKKNKN